MVLLWFVATVRGEKNSSDKMKTIPAFSENKKKHSKYVCGKQKENVILNRLILGKLYSQFHPLKT
jgi:3-hydroxyacyl-CoA dehydrogenase